jgi:hypothetical protein
VILSGIAVSLLVAPSFSYRNVLVCAPFGWFLVGRLYDAAGPRGHTRSGAIAALFIALLLASQSIVLARGRLLPTNEPWRASAAFVQSLPGCARADIPVLALPGTYGVGPASAMQAMVGGHYYGYYLPPSYRPHVYFPDGLLRYVAQSQSACPVIGWVLHDVSDEKQALVLARQLAGQPGMANHQVLVQEFVSYELSGLAWKPVARAFVFLRATPQVLDAPASSANAAGMVDRTRSIGDRLLVTYIPANGSYDIRRSHPATGA